MSNTQTLKCPSCGAYLVYDPEAGRFTCPFCSAAFTQAEVEQRTAKASAQQAAPHTHAYHCTNCGAELVTDETTAATFCYYCHNPVTLMDRVSDDFHPDGIIPFTLSRDQAQKKFKEYLSQKKFVRREFLSEDSLEKMTGVYYPYWVGTVDGHGNFQGEGTRVTTTPTTIITKYYDVHRTGTLHFQHLVRKALNKCDRKLSDGIHPYHFEKTKPFSTSYLSGFVAEMRDVEKHEVEADMVHEAHEQTDKLMRAGMSFDTLRGDTTFVKDRTDLRYLLLPAWVLTYWGDKPGTTYYYMMNGQGGEVCGKLPIRWGKLLGVAALAGGIVCGLLCMGGMLLW